LVLSSYTSKSSVGFLINIVPGGLFGQDVVILQPTTQWTLLETCVLSTVSHFRWGL